MPFLSHQPPGFVFQGHAQRLQHPGDHGVLADQHAQFDHLLLVVLVRQL
jgi:hypothetical protein